MYWHEVKDKSCALNWSRPVPYYLELTNCAGRHQVALAVAKDKRYAWRGRHQVALAVAKDKRYALSGLSTGCAGRRQRHETERRQR